MSKTTIQVSKQTKAELDNLKKGDTESYDHTLQRIIREHDGDADALTESRVREIVREETENNDPNASQDSESRYCEYCDEWVDWDLYSEYHISHDGVQSE